ncbi:sensor histidine kinase-like protein/response regulator Fos-1 [Aaosphaeria arxii CBS 175.79]|uniref:Sensor histidine kinase-like protein/response regulator Fos-1 n=1 Tax=Aaosphaeria arxii CBS 175.79 TaxID=1450172 RepID=A0A6A5XIT2_9PLEO|nr:sensor histidine kinase-like protein/response regulator Fos-1 [Aaosphaeria arxii CBS 175.79]KAF2012776.1 sensor histidine kinase-like protein/response regulator Fos-1 [Aaosphaeria arxii CBS 175.79]
MTPSLDSFAEPATSAAGSAMPHQQQHHTDDANVDVSLGFFRLTPIPTIILDASSIVRQVSETYLQISGNARREHVLGRPLHDLLGSTLLLPSLSLFHKTIETVHESRQPCKQSQIHQDGTAWTIRAVPIYSANGLQYIHLELEDTTAEHQKQLELQEELHANETFRILVQSVKDYAIFLLDKDGNVMTWNPGAERFKGYSKEEIMGKHFSTFYCKEDLENGKPQKELADAVRDGRLEDEGWRYRKDGSKFWANVIITPIYRGESLIGFVKVSRDLTERRKVEADLITAFQESSQLKSEFLANMSHEIRTPMHGMLSALTLLLDTSLDSEQLELARLIEESGDILMQVINDILDYSKLTHGGFSISRDIINIPDIVQSVFKMHEKSCGSRLSLGIDIDPRLPTAAEGDSLRYRQIVQNLLSNATKFTDEGYVLVKAALEDEDDERYTIITEVIDTGVGIPSDASNSLFKPFVQFDNSATKRFKGTGLGLSICKSLAELMDGRIGYRPNPEGCGSIFSFTAQLKKVHQYSVVTPIQDGDVDENACKSNLAERLRTIAADTNVLIAEDNPINQKVILKILQGLGFTNIDLAINGREAAKMAIEACPPYKIILMDINMPGLDGASATKAIRDAGMVMPIVAMTANALKGQAEAYLAKGMSAYISKPVDRDILVKTLLRCLKDD